MAPMITDLAGLVDMLMINSAEMEPLTSPDSPSHQVEIYATTPGLKN
jgi:hypothetical protein